MKREAMAAAMAVMLLAANAVAADDVPALIDSGRQFYQKGDIARAAHQLEMALANLQDRLGRGLSEDMPPVPAGWQGEDPEVQGLGAVGGGLSVTRAYTKGDSSLNASLILDSPAVEAAAALFVNSAADPTLRRVKVDTEDALLRWDPAGHSGEITLVVSSRVLLQIEGDNLLAGDVLIDMAKGFNVAGMRKLIGI